MRLPADERNEMTELDRLGVEGMRGPVVEAYGRGRRRRQEEVARVRSRAQRDAEFLMLVRPAADADGVAGAAQTFEQKGSRRIGPGGLISHANFGLGERLLGGGIEDAASQSGGAAGGPGDGAMTLRIR